jgi:hypothetical protein
MISNKKTYNTEIIEHSFFDTLNTIYNSITEPCLYTIENQYQLEKLHKPTKYPLMYLHYLEITEKDPMSFSAFYEYYSENINEYKKIFNIESSISKLLKDSENRSQLHKNLYSNPFVSIDVTHVSESFNLLYTKVKLNNGIIHLYEIIKDSEDDSESDSDSDNNPSKLNIDMLCFVINFMECFIKKYNIEIIPINLTIFLSPQTKKIIDKFNFLGPININSGSTYPRINIFLWRKEELLKVLIHELIHFYGIDYNLFINNKETDFCIVGEDRNNEAYTESLAILINTFIFTTPGT